MLPCAITVRIYLHHLHKVEHFKSLSFDFKAMLNKKTRMVVERHRGHWQPRWRTRMKQQTLATAQGQGFEQCRKPM